MILSAHQPVYLPWLGLFHKIALADKFCFFDSVQYQAKNWNNRNRIRFGDGSVGWLTVPVLRKSYLERSYLDIRINNDFPWQRKHWKSIELSYGKYPYFGLYKRDMKRFYDMKWEFLADLNYEMLLFFMEKLGISASVTRMRDHEFHGCKSELILDMCRQLGAHVYIFGEKGRDYADIEGFLRAGVRPVFQEYVHPAYPQAHGEFIPCLSVIDLLFSCGPDSLDIIMTGNMKRSELN